MCNKKNIQFVSTVSSFPNTRPYKIQWNFHYFFFTLKCLRILLVWAKSDYFIGREIKVGPISTNLGAMLFRWREFKFFQIKDHILFQGEINNNILAKIHKQIKKIFFSRINGPISTKHGTKYLGWRGFKFVQIKRHSFFKKKIILI